mmetsp:Transcript_14567/g.41913  ORF Transcript_14567/g.41913 Transcript_14567/m.41913 type:complete len:219 (+) Transcript_14567:3356-4012(+)
MDQDVVGGKDAQLEAKGQGPDDLTAAKVKEGTVPDMSLPGFGQIELQSVRKGADEVVAIIAGCPSSTVAPCRPQIRHKLLDAALQSRTEVIPMHEVLDGIEPFDEFGRVRLQVGHDVGDIPNDGGVDRHANNDPQKDVKSFGTCDGHHIANDHHHQRWKGPVEGSDVQLPQIAAAIGSGQLAILDLTLNPGSAPKALGVCVGPIHDDGAVWHHICRGA